MEVIAVSWQRYSSPGSSEVGPLYLTEASNLGKAQLSSQRMCVFVKGKNREIKALDERQYVSGVARVYTVHITMSSGETEGSASQTWHRLKVVTSKKQHEPRRLIESTSTKPPEPITRAHLIRNVNVVLLSQAKWPQAPYQGC